MSDAEMEIDDHNTPETHQHQSGLPGYKRAHDESMEEETSGGEDSPQEDTHELDEVDPEALKEIDPSAILPQRIRQTDPVDYTSPDALAKAGLTREELEKEGDDDHEFVDPEEAQGGLDNEADITME